ncbi:hypothetical protein ACS0TY_024461 [Phlomoides rotata]
MAKACDVLSKPQNILLETYCSVATNKLVQVWILSLVLIQHGENSNMKKRVKYG